MEYKAKTLNLIPVNNSDLKIGGFFFSIIHVTRGEHIMLI